MLKKIVFFVSFITITFTAQAQNVINGNFIPKDKYSWVMLYQIKSNKQVYIANSQIKDGAFSIPIPLSKEKGIMRLVYSTDNGKYIDFIYDQKSVSFTCNPDKMKNTIHFKDSEENNLYFNYLRDSEELQIKADSLQVSYLKNAERSVAKSYRKTVKKLSKIQDKYERKSEGMIANHFIKAQKKYYSKKVIENPQVSLNSIKEHFFDYIDFSDEYLKNSALIPQKILEYVFHINSSDDVEVQNKIYKKSCLDILEKVEKDMLAKRNMLEFLLINFSKIKNIPTVDFLTGEYKKLQKGIQNTSFLKEIEDKMRLAIGKKAPNFYWGDNDKNSLYQQPKNKNYILVFWSTSCPHCLDEIPKLYEYTKNNKDITVFAIALENDDLGFKHYSEKFPKWTHILSLDKWKNNIAQLYEIHSTPTYYIFDENKRIIANPEYLKDIKAFFKSK